MREFWSNWELDRWDTATVPKDRSLASHVSRSVCHGIVSLSVVPYYPVIPLLIFLFLFTQEGDQN